MKTVFALIQILSFFVLAASSVPVFAHGGGLDSYGCHHNRKAGGYHCHRGPLAGESFSSQSEMLSRLKQTKGAKTR